MIAAQGKARLEELAILFLRTNRPLPTELLSYSNAGRFAEATRIADEAVALAATPGRSAFQQVLQEHRRQFRAGRPLRENRVVFELTDLQTIHPNHRN